MSVIVSSVQPKRNVPAKSIALPVEHGAWGFLFEPLVAGLILAPSFAAPFVALLFVGAFLARQPLRFLLADWQQGRNLPRTRLALRFALIYSAIAVSGLIGAVIFAPAESFLPLVILAPLTFYLVSRDVARQTRQLLPELIAAVVLSSSVAVLALAAHWSLAASLAIWAVLIARLIPSIVFVRTRLRQLKGKEASPAIAIGVHYLALFAVSALAYFGLVPVLAILVMTVLLLRAIYGVSPFSPKNTAKEIGLREIAYGVFTLIGVLTGFFLTL